MKHSNNDTFDLKPLMEDVLLDLKNTPDTQFEVLRAAVVEKFDCQNDHRVWTIEKIRIFIATF